jgi:hypothetical protein
LHCGLFKAERSSLKSQKALDGGPFNSCNPRAALMPSELAYATARIEVKIKRQRKPLTWDMPKESSIF